MVVQLGNVAPVVVEIWYARPSPPFIAAKVKGTPTPVTVPVTEMLATRSSPEFAGLRDGPAGAVVGVVWAEETDAVSIPPRPETSRMPMSMFPEGTEFETTMEVSPGGRLTPKYW